MSQIIRTTRHRKAPAHKRVTEEIRRRIEQGEMLSGSLVPSRRALAEELDIAIGTVQKAITDLTADGTLVVQGTRGTFVAPMQGPVDRTFRRARKLVETPNTPLSSLSTVVIGALDRDTVSTQQGTFWMRTVLTAVEKTVSSAGGTCAFVNLRLPNNRELLHLRDAVKTAIDDGASLVLIVQPPDLSEWRSLATSNDVNQVPIVFVGPTEITYPFYSVSYDSRDAGCQAATHLIEGGAKKLTFFSPYSTDYVHDRSSGMFDAAQQYNIPSEDVWLTIKSDFNMDVVAELLHLADSEHDLLAYEYAKEYLADGLKAEGIVAANDFVAYGFMRAASEYGFVAGKHYTIVGFDDYPRSFELGLSTLRPPLEDLGREAVQLGIRAVNKDRAVLRSSLHSHLIVRTSGSFDV